MLASLRPPPSLLSIVCGMLLCAITPLIALVRNHRIGKALIGIFQINTPPAIGFAETARASVKRKFPELNVASFDCVLG